MISHSHLHVYFNMRNQFIRNLHAGSRKTKKLLQLQALFVQENQKLRKTKPLKIFRTITQ